MKWMAKKIRKRFLMIVSILAGVVILYALMIVISGSGKKTLTPVRMEVLPEKTVVLTPGNSSDKADDITITRIAHASVLIEIGGRYILTDPWFSRKPGYDPGEPLGVALRDLPPLSAVIVSHEHYDHFDVETFQDYRDKSVPVIVKTGMGQAAGEAGFTQVQVVEPWQEVQVGDIRITATPASHGVPENSYIIQAGGRTIFFAGDTRLIPELKEVAVRFPEIDLALVSINGLMVRPLVNKQMVMNAEEAGVLLSWLRPRVAVPVHYTFTAGMLRDHLLLKYDGTPERFVNAATLQAPHTLVQVLETGQPLRITSNTK